MLTRRRFLAFASMAPVMPVPRQHVPAGSSRLAIPPERPTQTIAPGEHALRLDVRRDGLLVVPKRYRADSPAPLAILLHGAGGQARRILSLLGMAQRLGVVVLAPDSRGSTWDVIRGDFGADVEFLDRALVHTFERCAIDHARVAIGGFSDGASYALSLGLDNGTFFTHILAFSPGFVASRAPRGRPRVFVAHGVRDEILPIAATSRRLVPALEKAGYPVRYREFNGPHTVPTAVAHEAFSWFTG